MSFWSRITAWHEAPRKDTLADRVRVITLSYEKMFAERTEHDVCPPSDPLEFHLYHLARYWSRLVGFCKQVSPENCVESDLDACVQVGSEFTNKMISLNSPFYGQWQECWNRTQAILKERPVTVEDIEAASQSFDKCLAELKYDPWK